MEAARAAGAAGAARPRRGRLLVRRPGLRLPVHRRVGRRTSQAPRGAAGPREQPLRRPRAGNGAGGGSTGARQPVRRPRAGNGARGGRPAADSPFIDRAREMARGEAPAPSWTSLLERPPRRRNRGLACCHERVPPLAWRHPGLLPPRRRRRRAPGASSRACSTSSGGRRRSSVIFVTLREEGGGEGRRR